ncbi:MAG: hypothetical protein MUE90_11520 [Thermoanaerobaculales bacterium]|jgi:hypothetical protein|nr:hypothetical protein [Thermoanaerobaculales bacterium]
MLLSVVLWAALAALPRETVAAGTPIVAITVIRSDVFDLSEPGTSAWPYRAANALHVVSRESFVRSLLLFRVGDPLDPALLAESERLLRATGFLSPVTIAARPAPGGAEVVVHTRDQWTTELGLNLNLAGKQQKYGVTLTEQNFAGRGKRVEAVWRHDEERESLTAIYFDPLLLGSRWVLDAAYSDTSDGSAERLRLERPFFSLDTRRAGGGAWQRESLVEYLWAGGDKQVAGAATLQAFRFWGGIGLPSSGRAATRLTAGVFGDRAQFSGWSYLDGRPYPTPADRDLVGLEIGVEHQSDRWEVIQGLRAWSRQEDVPLGPNVHAAVGISLPALGGESGRLRFSADVELGARRGEQYSWLVAASSGRLDHASAANVVLHAELGTARTGAHGWRARVAADVGHELDGERQLALGADSGLRGWDPFTFDGTSRAVANLEYRRRLTGEVLHLGIIGMTVFADAGRTWNPRVGADTGGVRFAAGAGLAVELTRAAILRIVRVEVGFGDDGSGPLVLLTGSSLF